MKHLSHITRAHEVPAAASLLEMQQKVVVLGGLVEVFNALGEAISTWPGLRDKT